MKKRTVEADGTVGPSREVEPKPADPPAPTFPGGMKGQEEGEVHGISKTPKRARLEASYYDS